MTVYAQNTFGLNGSRHSGTQSQRHVRLGPISERHPIRQGTLHNTTNVYRADRKGRSASRSRCCASIGIRAPPMVGEPHRVLLALSLFERYAANMIPISFLLCFALLYLSCPGLDVCSLSVVGFPVVLHMPPHLYMLMYDI